MTITETLPRFEPVRSMPPPTISPDESGVEVPNRVVLSGVSWDDYEKLGEIFADRPIRLTYDRGSLEIMTLSMTHESYSNFLAELIVCMADELGIDRWNLGSTTFKKEDLERGLEPDKCFYLDSYPRIRGKRTIDLEVDPPPDLALEIDISRSSIDRLGIYAGLKIREVWRFDGKTLEVRRLVGEEYQRVDSSPQFPRIPLAIVEGFLRRSLDEPNGQLMREFRTWLGERIAANWQTDS